MAPIIAETVKNINYFLVEEIRTARRFISSLKTGRVIEEMIFHQVDKSTKEHEVLNIIKGIPESENIGVISEAGCPGIADPGAVVVTAGNKLNRIISPLPGPSSIFLTLMASGLSGQKFCFRGYLPIERPLRKKEIKILEVEALKGQSQIFMETPYRNNQLLEDLLIELAPNTRLCIGSEVTSKAEYIRTMTVNQWKANIPDLHRKPTIFIVGS